MANDLVRFSVKSEGNLIHTQEVAASHVQRVAERFRFVLSSQTVLAMDESGLSKREAMLAVFQVWSQKARNEANACVAGGFPRDALPIPIVWMCCIMADEDGRSAMEHLAEFIAEGEGGAWVVASVEDGGKSWSVTLSEVGPSGAAELPPPGMTFH